MLRRLIVICSLAFPVAGAWSQSARDPQIQLKELASRVMVLENENRRLISQKNSHDSLAYFRIRKEIFEAYAGLSDLGSDYRSTIDKMAVTGLFTRLMQANNPTSDILGFRFSELILTTAEKHFAGKLVDESDRKRFSHVIAKIIENPVVSSLAQTNPVTSVVASIIGTIATFSTARIQAAREAGKPGTLTVNQEDVFDSKSISAFRKELQVYIGFYDDLIGASDKYLAGLDHLEMKYAFLVKRVQSYQQEFDRLLRTEEVNPLISLTRALPEPSNNNLDFSTLLANEQVMACCEMAESYPLIRQSVESLQADYNTLLYNFLEDYAGILEKAKNFPENVIDHSRIDQLTGEIELFVREQGL